MVLASTELHHSMEGRNLVRVGTIGEFKKNPKFVHEMGETPPSDLTLYPEFDYAKGYQWGMVVNLGACIGCNACVLACQAARPINWSIPYPLAMDRTSNALFWAKAKSFCQAASVFSASIARHCPCLSPCDSKNFFAFEKARRAEQMFTACQSRLSTKT